MAAQLAAYRTKMPQSRAISRRQRRSRRDGGLPLHARPAWPKGIGGGLRRRGSSRRRQKMTAALYLRRIGGVQPPVSTVAPHAWPCCRKHHGIGIKCICGLRPSAALGAASLWLNVAARRCVYTAGLGGASLPHETSKRPASRLPRAAASSPGNGWRRHRACGLRRNNRRGSMT